MTGQTERSGTGRDHEGESNLRYGVYHLVRRESDLGANWDEKAIEAREPFDVIYARSSHLRPIHHTGRWLTLLAMINLPA